VVTTTGAPLLLNFIIPATILGSAMAIFMMWTQYEFKRWEGLVLILFYGVFIAVLLAIHEGIIDISWNLF
jgi:Ca2+/Na+ antiporter